MPEFRWILVGLGSVLLGGIWWWGARRSRQAPGNSQMREFTAPVVTTSAPDAFSAGDNVEAEESGDWGVPPFEPLSIRTADFDDVPHIDLSMTAHSEPFDDTLDLSNSERLPVAAPAASVSPPLTQDTKISAGTTPVSASQGGTIAAYPTSVPPRLAGSRTASPVVPVVKVSAARTVKPTAPTTAHYPESSDRFSSIEAEEPNTAERQRIVSIRVAAGEEMWRGADLLTVLEDLGLAHGRYQVFHRKHSDGRTLFCAASLVEPGTFDLAAMPDEEYRGLTLFAVLPGPADPLQTIDAMIVTAQDIAQALQGTVQISKGVPLSAQDVATLREDVARFQASMTG